MKTKSDLIFPMLLVLGVIFLTFGGCATQISRQHTASAVQTSLTKQEPVPENPAEQQAKGDSTLPSETTSSENGAQKAGGNNQQAAQEIARKPDKQAGVLQNAGLMADQTVPEQTEETETPATVPEQEGKKKEGVVENTLPPGHDGIPKKTNQELLDGALEFCQASNDFWKRGELDNALAALDQAYSLILKVDPDDNPELLQQREDLRFTIAKRIIEVYSSRLTVVNGYHKAIPLSMNRYVQQAIRQFQGRDRKFFLQSYKRSGRYRPAIVKALKKAGLPEDLSWLPLIESGFKVRAFSKARALGLWQFIASTGYKYGLERDRWVDERMNPEKATQAAISYLKELHQIFGDWSTVLAAYNCGAGTVLRCIRTQRAKYLDNFWDLYEKLPRETAFYVPKFLAVLHILQDPEKYGITLPPVDPPLEVDKVTIDRPIHLKTIAKNIDVPYRELRNLNPELKRNSTPARSYDLKVPKGKGAILLAKLPKLPAWKLQIPEFVYHKVRRGEVLSLIARKYRTSVRAIMRTNRLRSSRYLRVGWKLKIPVGRKYVLMRRQPVLYQNHAGMQMIGKKRHVVKRGDSLWKIARRFGTTTDAIKKTNTLKDSHLSIGQVLVIQSRPGPTKKMNARKYRVKEGDSPYIIAQKHQMNLSEFLRLNSLTPRSTIFPGQTMLVRAD